MEDLKAQVKDLTTTQVMNGLYIDLNIGCLNRRAFEARKSEGVTLLDVDSLKWVNDNLGHAAGDRLLRHVAERLQNEFGNDVVYRLSGDEFAIRHDIKIEYMHKLTRVAKNLGCVSFGIAGTLEEADDWLKTNKEQRLLHGHRAPRGERPAWADADWLEND